MVNMETTMTNTASGTRFYVGQRVRFVGEFSDGEWRATVRQVAKNGRVRIEFWGRSKMDFQQLRVMWVYPSAIEEVR